ncbi:MAG: hypothetical protein Q9187_002836 [Circinaria calcarea]
MSGFNEGRANWMDFFLVEEKLGKGVCRDEDAILFVDVGGGFGHQAVALRKRFPNLPGRFVLQDLPSAVAGLQLEGVEATVHDFLRPQPLKGARAYYFRNVLHDWSDEIKLLINQWVIPTRHSTRFMTFQDLNMMALLAATERTETQWEELLDKAGFRIVQIWQPNDDVSESLIEAVVKYG